MNEEGKESQICGWEDSQRSLIDPQSKKTAGNSKDEGDDPLETAIKSNSKLAGFTVPNPCLPKHCTLKEPQNFNFQQIPTSYQPELVPHTHREALPQEPRLIKSAHHHNLQVKPNYMQQHRKEWIMRQKHNRFIERI